MAGRMNGMAREPGCSTERTRMRPPPSSGMLNVPPLRPATVDDVVERKRTTLFGIGVHITLELLIHAVAAYRREIITLSGENRVDKLLCVVWSGERTVAQ